MDKSPEQKLEDTSEMHPGKSRIQCFWSFTQVMDKKKSYTACIHFPIYPYSTYVQNLLFPLETSVCVSWNWKFC